MRSVEMPNRVVNFCGGFRLPATAAVVVIVLIASGFVMLGNRHFIANILSIFAVDFQVFGG